MGLAIAAGVLETLLALRTKEVSEKGLSSAGVVCLTTLGRVLVSPCMLTRYSRIGAIVGMLGSAAHIPQPWSRSKPWLTELLTGLAENRRSSSQSLHVDT